MDRKLQIRDQIDVQANSLMRVECILERRTIGGKIKRKDLIDDIMKAASDNKINVVSKKCQLLKNNIFRDSVKVCTYRSGVKTVLDDIRQGKSNDEVVALLEQILEETKDGIYAIGI